MGSRSNYMSQNVSENQTALHGAISHTSSIETKSVTDLMSDIQDYARQHPTQSAVICIGAGLLVGFLLGRLPGNPRVHFPRPKKRR